MSDGCSRNSDKSTLSPNGGGCRVASAPDLFCCFADQRPCCCFRLGQFAEAASLRQGVAAFNRRDYVAASWVFIPLAERGDPAAQTYLGFMFETGRGVPQNYTEAAMWYRRAAEQGDGLAQYSLGLLYDKGQGVPRDIVEASKWLNLSTAAAPARVSGSAGADLRCGDDQDDARRDRAGPAARAGVGAEPRVLRALISNFAPACGERRKTGGAIGI